MAEEIKEPESPGFGRVRRATAVLALAGSVLMLAVAGLVTASVLRRWIGGEEIPGAFELVQIGTALGVFSFLPYAQVRRANIVVDTFTTRLPRRWNARIDALWDFVYAAAAGVIAWRLVAGAQDTITSGTTSMVLGLPTGWAILACSVMAGILAVVAFATSIFLLKVQK